MNSALPANVIFVAGRAVQKAITYVGLDVHKGSIVVSVAEAGLRGRLQEVREYGKVPNTPAALKAMATKLAAAGNGLRFCYEAGPCGYGVQRQLSAMGHHCAVVAPSLVPRKPGERIKTDRRDAAKLAKLHRAGELTAVWVPDPAHEAMRDIARHTLDGALGARKRPFAEGAKTPRHHEKRWRLPASYRNRRPRGRLGRRSDGERQQRQICAHQANNERDDL